MMRKVLGYALFLLLGLFLVGVFIDKNRVWYTIESAIAPYEIVIDGQTVTNAGWGMDIHEAALYVYGMHAATIEMIAVRPWMVRNTITLSKVTIPADLKIVQGLGIDEANITHVLWEPSIALIDAAGSFGTLQGRLDLKERTIHITIDPSTLLLQNRTLMAYIKRTKEGYSYVGRF